MLLPPVDRIIQQKKKRSERQTKPVGQRLSDAGFPVMTDEQNLSQKEHKRNNHEILGRGRKGDLKWLIFTRTQQN